MRLQKALCNAFSPNFMQDENHLRYTYSFVGRLERCFITVRMLTMKTSTRTTTATTGTAYAACSTIKRTYC